MSPVDRRLIGRGPIKNGDIGVGVDSLEALNLNGSRRTFLPRRGQCRPRMSSVESIVQPHAAASNFMRGLKTWKGGGCSQVSITMAFTM